MANYEIADEQYRIAQFYLIEIQPSHHKRKKIDVYKNGEFLCSVGAVNFEDYHQMMKRMKDENEGILKEEDKYILIEKREKYRRRHQYKNTDEALYSMRLLW